MTDIEDMVSPCCICQTFSPRCESLHPHEIPDLAFGKIGMDIGTRDVNDK